MIKPQTKKIIRRKCSEPSNLNLEFPEYLARIYAARGVVSIEELDNRLAALEGNSRLRGLSEAIALLEAALRERRLIIVVGDFDADGATSTALAVDVLRAMGARCEYLVPNRFEYGYGLTPEIVELAAEQQPDLIVTVDNGISSIEGVDRANQLGMKVLITDHHLPGQDTPNAAAIVNPNQLGCEFVSKNSAGVGVIFYVMSSLRTSLIEKGWFAANNIDAPNMANYLDLVALGTVADLVPFDKNNRILVEQGLRRMRARRCRPGIAALLEIAKKDLARVSSSDLGFVVGPRLNAAGRMDDMSLGIECLLARDMLDARDMAVRLNALNIERRQVEDDMRRDAEAILKELPAHKQDVVGICLYQSHWHQGVIGILAARVKEAAHRPTIAFAPEVEGEAGHSPADEDILKGSARSIPGLHMRDTLDLIAKQRPDILQKFGGHAMAAGMTIKAKDYNAFAELFDNVVRKALDEESLQATIHSDGELSELQLDLASVTTLESAGPWGQQFPEPAFDGVFDVLQKKILKEKHLKLVIRQSDGEALFDAIQFNSPFLNESFSVPCRMVYRPNINEFRGRKTVQLLIDYIELGDVVDFS